MNLRQIATGLSLYLVRQVDLPEERVDSLRFGLEIIIGSLIKGIILFALAGALNILIEVTVALVVGSAFRLLAGGAHCTGYVRCLFLGLTVYLVTGWVAKSYGLLISSHLLIFLVLSVFLLCFLIVIRWAPGEVPGKKLTSSKHRQFKVLSLLYLFLWLGTTLYLAAQGYSSLVLAGLLALLAQGFSVVPIGYRLIDWYDSILGKGVTEMLARFKKAFYTPVVMMALFVAIVGIKPASYFLWYQPEPPRES